MPKTPENSPNYTQKYQLSNTRKIQNHNPITKQHSTKPPKNPNPHIIPTQTTKTQENAKITPNYTKNTQKLLSPPQSYRTTQNTKYGISPTQTTRKSRKITKITTTYNIKTPKNHQLLETPLKPQNRTSPQTQHPKFTTQKTYHPHPKQHNSVLYQPQTPQNPEKTPKISQNTPKTH